MRNNQSLQPTCLPSEGAEKVTATESGVYSGDGGYIEWPSGTEKGDGKVDITERLSGKEVLTT